MRFQSTTRMVCFTPPIFVQAPRDITGGKLLQIRSAVHAVTAKMLEHCDVAAHPRCTLHDGNCDLFARERIPFITWCPRAGPKTIPFAVVDWNRMDIVCCAVIIYNAQLLLSLNPDHVRQIHASFLVNLYWFRRTSKLRLASPSETKTITFTERADHFPSRTLR